MVDLSHIFPPLQNHLPVDLSHGRLKSYSTVLQAWSRPVRSLRNHDRRWIDFQASWWAFPKVLQRPSILQRLRGNSIQQRTEKGTPGKEKESWAARRCAQKTKAWLCDTARSRRRNEACRRDWSGREHHGQLDRSHENLVAKDPRPQLITNNNQGDGNSWVIYLYGHLWTLCDSNSKKRDEMRRRRAKKMVFWLNLSSKSCSGKVFFQVTVCLVFLWWFSFLCVCAPSPELSC